MKILTHPAFLIVVVILVTGLTRGYGIQDESQWYDEVLVTRNLDAENLGEFLDAIRIDNPPVSPLYFVLIYFWNMVSPDNVIWLRCFSVLLSIATAMLILYLGNRYVSPAAGFIAAMLHAVAFDSVYFGQEMRMYALTVFLSTIVIAIFFRLLKTPDEDAINTWLWCGLSCGVSSLLFQTHVLAFFLLCGEALALLILRWRRIYLVFAFAITHTIAVVPPILWVLGWEQHAVDQGTKWIGLTPSFGGPQVLVWIQSWTPGGWHLWDTAGTIIATLVTAIVVGWFLITWWRADADRRETLIVLALCAWTPVILLQVGSILLQPMFIPRYVLYSIVPFFLLIGTLTVSIDRAAWRIGIATVLVVGATLALVSSPRPFRTDWLSAEPYLRQRVEEGAVVVLISGIAQEVAAAVLPHDTDAGILHARNRVASLGLPVVLARGGKMVLLTGTRSDIARLREVSPESSLRALPPGTFEKPERVFPSRMNPIHVYEIVFPEEETE